MSRHPFYHIRRISLRLASPRDGSQRVQAAGRHANDASIPTHSAPGKRGPNAPLRIRTQDTGNPSRAQHAQAKRD